MIKETGVNPTSSRTKMVRQTVSKPEIIGLKQKLNIKKIAVAQKTT